MAFNLNLLKNIDEFNLGVETQTKLQKAGIYNLWDLSCECVESLEKKGIKTTQMIILLEENNLSLQTNKTFSTILKGLSKSGVSYLKNLDKKYFEKDSNSFEIIKKLTKKYFDYKIYKNYETKRNAGINSRIREDKIADEIETYERVLIDKQEALSCGAGPVDRLKKKIRGVNDRFSNNLSKVNSSKKENINE